MTSVCRLWVQNADYSVIVRADRIVGVRAVALPGIDDKGYRWRLDLVVLDPAGDGASQVVPLCKGRHELFDNDGPTKLLALIAEHLDDPAGGIIDAADEDVATDMERGGLGGLFTYASFADQRNRPRPVR